jgi:hypothetical protein
MARTVELTPAQKSAIATQLGSRLGTRQPMNAPGGAGAFDEVTESFPVFVVDDQLTAAPGAAPKMLLRSHASDTGTIHHNIARNVPQAPGSATPASNTVVGVARTRYDPASQQYKVQAVAEPTPGNELPRWIRNAAHWIDQNAPGNPFARLLLIPSRYMHCFWLSYDEKDCVVVVDMPESFTHLEYRKLYDADQFFALLQQEPEVRGLGR